MDKPLLKVEGVDPHGALQTILVDESKVLALGLLKRLAEVHHRGAQTLGDQRHHFHDDDFDDTSYVTPDELLEVSGHWR